MKKHSIYRVWYYPWFQASIKRLGIYLPWTKGDYCIYLFSSYNKQMVQFNKNTFLITLIKKKTYGTEPFQL